MLSLPWCKFNLGETKGGVIVCGLVLSTCFTREVQTGSLGHVHVHTDQDHDSAVQNVLELLDTSCQRSHSGGLGGRGVEMV